MLKKILAIACTIFMLAGMSAVALEPAPAPAPAVRNGGFESAYSSSDWAGSGVTLTEANLVSTHKHSGEKSLELLGQEGVVTYAKQTVQVNLVQGKRYMATVWYNNSEGTGTEDLSVHAGVYQTGTETKYVNRTINNEDITTTHNWKVLYLKFDAPENLTSVDIWLGNYSKKAGEPIYFDDITLEEVPPVTGGDFEFEAWQPNNKDTSKIDRVSGQTDFGDYCMEIIGGSQYDPNIYNEGVRLKTNTEYKVSFCFKTNSANGHPRVRIGGVHYVTNTPNADSDPTWCFSVFDSAANDKPPVSLNTWVKCTYYFKTGETIPNNNGKTYILLFGLPNMTCWYDNVEIVEATNKIMLHDMAGTYGTDVTGIKNLPANTTLYAKGRFIPAGDSTSAVLMAAVFDESTGTKQLKDIKVAPYTGTNGAAQTLEAAITVENPETSSVEVYMWDSLSGMSRYLKKLRVTAAE